MENLYRNSPTMSLKPEYKSSLHNLCLSMLFYFSSALELRRAQLTEVKTNGGMNEAVFNQEHKSGVKKQLQWRCGALLNELGWLMICVEGSSSWLMLRSIVRVILVKRKGVMGAGANW